MCIDPSLRNVTLHSPFLYLHHHQKTSPRSQTQNPTDSSLSLEGRTSAELQSQHLESRSCEGKMRAPQQAQGERVCVGARLCNLTHSLLMHNLAPAPKESLENLTPVSRVPSLSKRPASRNSLGAADLPLFRCSSSNAFGFDALLQPDPSNTLSRECHNV